MPPTDILNKKQNYRLFQATEFGNKLRDWRSLKEWQECGWVGLCSLRTLMGGNGPCEYNLTPMELYRLWWHYYLRGIQSSDMVIGEMAPDDSITLQGEYLNDVYSHDGEVRCGQLLYSTLKAPMRRALAVSRSDVYGLQATIKLKSVMSPSSWADFEVLLERYPGHVLELSVYDQCLGNIPGRNTIVWEIRKY